MRVSIIIAKLNEGLEKRCNSLKTNYWVGDVCQDDIDDCLPVNPCQNDGQCSDIGTNSFSCECAKFWEGTTCDTAQTKFGK